MSYDDDDDGDSIQFAPQDDTDSIQFVEESGALDGTARSTATRRSRAVSIRSGKPDNASFGSSSAPGNWFTAGIAASSSTGGSPREGEAPQPRPTLLRGAAVSDDEEEPVLELRRRRVRTTTVSASTDEEVDCDDAAPDLPGTSSRGGPVGSSQARGKASAASAARAGRGAAAKESASQSPPRLAESMCLTNNSIVFTVLDEAAEDGGGSTSGAAAAASGPLISGMLKGTDERNASAKAIHKTVVSDTMRQRGSSIRSLKSDRSNSKRHGHSAAAQQPAQAPPSSLTSSDATTKSDVSSGTATAAAVATAASMIPEGPTRTPRSSVLPPQVPATAGGQALAPPPPSELFPAFANATGGKSTANVATDVASGLPPMMSSSLPPAAPTQPSVIAHGRTDSSKLVLEHLLDQEASNVFVQHKAKMLATPTNGVAPQAAAVPTTERVLSPSHASAAGGGGGGQQRLNAQSAPTPSAAVPVATPRTETRSRGLRDAAQEPTASARRATDNDDEFPIPSALRTPVAATGTAQRRARSGSANGGKPIPLSASTTVRNSNDRVRSSSSSRGNGGLARTSSPATHAVVIDRGALLMLPTDEVQLFQARALTNSVRHFNELQLGDLMRLDERLAAARMNTTASTAAGGAGTDRRERRSSAPSVTVRERTIQQASAAFPSFTGAAVRPAKLDSRHRYMDRVDAAPGDKMVRRSGDGASLPSPPRRRCVQEKDVSVIVRQTAQALGILPPTHKEWKKALADYCNGTPRVARTAPSSSSPAAKPVPHLFFTTGVRLTLEQQSQFCRLVRRRAKGHDEVEGDVVAHLLQEHPELANVSGSGGMVAWEHHDESSKGIITALSSHNRRSHSPPSVLVTAVAVTTADANVLQGRTATSATPRPASSRAPGSQRATSKRVHRTEVVRSVFDLLDMENTGVLHKSDLDSLRDALHEECDLFRIPSLGGGGDSGSALHRLARSSNHRYRGSARKVDDGLVGNMYGSGGNQSLVATAVATKEKTDSAFRGVTPTTGAATASCPFRKYGCHNRDEFRNLCQFAADIVIPILQRSNMEELEFPHVSMLLLSQAGPQSWLPLETRKTLTGFLEYFRETLH